MSSYAKKNLSKVVRAEVGLSGSPYPIKVVNGFQEPTTEGRKSRYTTRTGLPIYHPSAYAKRGWSSMVYHCSTLEIVVGAGWLISQGLA